MMMNNVKPTRWIVAAIVVSFFLLMLAACGDSTEVEGDPQPDQGGQQEAESPDEAEQDEAGESDEGEQEESGEGELPATIAVGTEPVGGGYHTSASGWAALLTDKTSMRAVVQPSSGTTTYMPNLNDGRLDLAIMNGPNLGW